MKTKKKSKKMVGRSALMASLIVAAITGVTPAFAAATSDNITSQAGPVTIGADQTRYLKTTNVTIGALTVTGTDGATGQLHIGRNIVGGVDKAQPNSTLTTDNMTIERFGSVEVTNNSTLNIKAMDPTVAGTLELSNGTVRIADGAGTLYLVGGDKTSSIAPGQLYASAGINTVDGSVQLGGIGKGSGKVLVNDGALLTINKDLLIHKEGLVDVSGTLVVKGNTKGFGETALEQGKIDIQSGGQMTAKKSDFLTDAYGKAIKVVIENDGTLYLNTKDNYTKDQLAAAIAALKGTGTGTVNFLGGALVGGNPGDAPVIVDATGSVDTVFLGNTVKLSTDTISADIGAKTLDTTAGTVVKVGDGSLQLTGNGGELITGTAKGNVEITDAAGSLNLGVAGNDSAQGGHLSSITMTVDGDVNVTDGIFSTDKLTASAGTITVASEGKTTSFSSAATDLSGTARMNVLQDSTAYLGTLKSSTGSSILVDPAIVVVKDIEASGLGADFIIGLGGNVVIGDTNANWMIDSMSDLGVKSMQEDTSVLAVRKTVTMATGGVIYLDPTVTMNSSGDPVVGTTPVTPAHGLTFNNGSLVIADMENLKDGVIFDLTNSDKKTAFIDDGAKLYLAGLKFKNNGQSLIKGADTDGITTGTDGTGWTGENGLVDPDAMLNASFNPTDGKLTVTINKASDVLHGMSSDTNGLMDEVWRTSENSVNSLNAGKKLVSRAADSNYMTPTEGARVVEGAARMAVVGATQQMAFATSNAATAAATQRTSMANPMANSSGTLTALVREEGSQQWKAENTGLSAGNGLKNGAALWIMPLYQNMNAWNMKADNFNTGYSANFGGVALGGDYTFADAFRVGLALNIGGGFAESNGDFAKTENNFNFWGINLYGGWAQNNFAVTADVGYTSTFNDVKQDTPLNLGMSEFKTDMYSYAITAGLRGEYKVQTDYVDIIPHIAARYTNLHSDDYKIKSGGETVFKGEAIDQSIWTFPIGVAFSKDVDMSNGWTFKPQLDLAVIPAAGDIAAKSKVKIPGNSVTADLESNIIDGISYQGALGFDMYKDNIAFGINYTIQASEHTTGHGVQATVRYEF